MGGALRGSSARLRPFVGLASLRGRRGRVGARVWAALLGLVPMLSVVSLSDAVSLSVVYRDPFFRIFGIYQRMYLYLYICRFLDSLRMEGKLLIF